MEMAAKMIVRGEQLMACSRQLRHSLASSRQAPAATWLPARCLSGGCLSKPKAVTRAHAAAGQHDPSSSSSGSASYSTASPPTSTTNSTSRASRASSNAPPSSSYIHLGLQQEKINTDGSLSTAYTWYRQQQMPHAANPTTTTTSSSSSTPGSSPGSSTSSTGSTGSSSPSSSSSSTQQQQAVQPRPPGLAAAAPSAAPITQQQLNTLADLIQCSKRVVVLTGAGCSTESNIPDYRGPSGAYTTGFQPMTHQQFVAKAENRARYWARSFAGWHEFAYVGANAAHEAIGRLQSMGWLDLVITQNVDRLHQKGGSSKVLELHGTTHRVVCLDCGHNTCRHDMQQRLAELNPSMAQRVRQMASAAGAGGISNRAAFKRALRAGTAADARKVTAGADAEQVPIVRPDGDVELADAGHNFKVPDCASCGNSTLKPDVVFFGDSVPKDRVQSALSAAQSADLILVVGSSLMVWSAFRLVKAAKEAGAALAIVNVGPTRADSLADVKVEALAGEVMMQLAMHPSLLVPRIG